MTKPDKPIDTLAPAVPTPLHMATNPAMKNAAAAPVIYFDVTPCWGTINGIIEMELAVQILSPKADMQVQADFVCVGHLRCSAFAATHLRNAIDAALAAINPAPGAPGDNPLPAAPNGGEPKH